MNKEEIKKRLFEIDDKIAELKQERDRLLIELAKFTKPPDLGVSVSDGLGIEDEVK